MNKTLCFIIESTKIYLEKVLVDYMGVPIFFLCRNSKQYYLALCTNIDELQYFVTKITPQQIFDLLNGSIAMREVILQQPEYWEIISNENPENDIVYKHPMEDIDRDLLPQENTVYEILTPDIKEYAKKFDRIFDESYFSWENQKDIYSQSTLFPSSSSNCTQKHDTELTWKDSFIDLGPYSFNKYYPVSASFTFQSSAAKYHEWSMNNNTNNTCAA